MDKLNNYIKESLRVGISFGLTSAVITTLGLIVGLNASTGSKFVVIGGILTIAIADAFSDALGIHLSEESEKIHTALEVWLSTIFTFLAKFLFALTFLIPVLLLELPAAIIASIAWGLLMLGILSVIIARDQKVNACKVVAEHLLVAVLVIFLSTIVGQWIARVFY